MTDEERLLLFYEDMVNELQNNPDKARDFFKDAITLTLIRPSKDRNIRVLEVLLQTCLSYKKKDLEEEIYASPFTYFDTTYYLDLLRDISLMIESSLISKVSRDLYSQKKNITTTFLDFKDREISKCYDTIYGLDKIIRAGWIKRNVDKTYQESDLVHTVQMFALACAFYHLANPKLNILRVYEIILIHEIGEVIVGDIREGTKEHLTKHDIERNAVVQIFSGLKNGNYYINLWDEFEKRETEEARFVYALDKIDPILKAKYLDRILDRTDLFDDFYSYEEERHTFDNSQLKKLFYSVKK